MNKSMYSEDIIWYDISVYNSIMALNDKYSNAIPVFGGALSAFNALEVGDMDRFETLMADAIDCAEFYKWHEEPIDVARRFCALCHVDPALIEAHIGMRFVELFEV